MKISNLPEIGVRPDLNKWYFEFQISLRPPYRVKNFIQPWVRVCFVKFLQLGEYGLKDGDKEIRKGGWRHWTFPWGIFIEITR